MRLHLDGYAREDCRSELRPLAPSATDDQLDVLIDAVVRGINMDRYTDRPARDRARRQWGNRS